MLITPYYRSLTVLSPSPSLACVPDKSIVDPNIATASYTPYDIFCLETRLYPIIYQMLGRDILLLFQTKYVNDRMELTVQITKIQNINSLEEVPKEVNVELTISQQQFLDQTMDKITSEYMGYCLIDKQELYLSAQKVYPANWFYTMLQYIQLSSEYQPFISYQGIYLSFDPDQDYRSLYLFICKYLLDKIDEYYKKGVIYGASSIAEDWSLEQIGDVERLFIPTWIDRRFAPSPVEFLLEKLQGDPYIRLRVSENLVTRHYIASILNEYEIGMVFEGDYLRVSANNLEEAQKISSLVRSVMVGNDEKVIIRNLPNLDNIMVYIDEITKLIPNSNCISYQTSSIEKPYVFSCLVDLNVYDTIVLKLFS